MKINLKLKESPYNFLRKAGYFFEGQKGGEIVFSRVLVGSKSGYPRFHIYLKVNTVSQETAINLHLDQKKPVYGGVVAHSGEYQGEIVEKEAERIRNLSDRD